MYGGFFVLSNALARSNPVMSYLPSYTMLAYDIILISWIFKTGQERDIGIRFIFFRGDKNVLWVLGLLLFPMINLLDGISSYLSFNLIVGIFASVLAEEVFFRGFLLRYLIRYGKGLGVGLSAGIFAVFHLSGLIGEADITFLTIQVLSAFGVGIWFGAVSLAQESLLICVLSHFLINFTGRMAPQAVMSVTRFWGFLICGGIYGWMGIRLCNKNKYV